MSSAAADPMTAALQTHYIQSHFGKGSTFIFVVVVLFLNPPSSSIHWDDMAAASCTRSLAARPPLAPRLLNRAAITAFERSENRKKKKKKHAARFVAGRDTTGM